MSFINFNGKIVDSLSPVVTAGNRGLRYGDGLFETLKFKNNQLILVDEHLSRLWQGLKLMQFELPKRFTPDYLEQQMLSLLQKNKLHSARIRLNVFRGTGGLYDPENLNPNFIIECWPLSENNGKLNENGLQCCIYKDALKSTDQFCNIKSNNFLPYLMGALFAKKNKFNDAIILNSDLNICDSTIANVFILKDDIIYTPPLSDGCIAGVMRAFVINELKKNGHSIIEESISIEKILLADEAFLTNSIYNLRWIAGIDEKSYRCQHTQQLFQNLSKTNPDIFC